MGVALHVDIFDAENGVLHGPRGDVELTPLEMRLVAALMARRGRLCGRAYLVEAVWPGEAAPLSAYDKAMGRLIGRVREKMEQVGLDPSALRTRVLLGYVLDV